MADTYSGDHIDFGGGVFHGPVTGKIEYREYGDKQPPGPVPDAGATLPAAPSGFVGRGAEVEELLQALRPDPPGGRWWQRRHGERRRRRERPGHGEQARPGEQRPGHSPALISAVSGMGGVGKTALALYCAHRARAMGWFPGGVLFVDLRGYDPGPLTADQAVLVLLDALGTRGDDLPRTATSRSALLRALLAERAERQGPMLLLLDNASAPEQISGLLPGTDRHRVLITSRDRLTSLPARLIGLDTLSADAATDLVAHALLIRDRTDDRPAREPDALLRLAALCGHLPLALQIAAAQLSHRRTRPIASLVDDIRATADRAGALESEGVDQYGKPLALRPVFEVSYGRLPADRARMLRLLALAPTAKISIVAALLLADTDSPGEVIAVLEELAAAHLVTPAEGSVIWWRMHDLVREYAAGVAAGDAQSAEEGEAARGRLLDFYRQCAHAAALRLRWLPGEPAPKVFGDRAQALEWLDAERANLVAAAQWAGNARHADAAINLALNLSDYLGLRRAFDALIAVSRAAQRAAHRTGEKGREASAWLNLGGALDEVGHAHEAIDAYARAGDLFRATGDREGEAETWANLGAALGDAGRPEEAFDALLRARDLFRVIGDRNREAVAWTNLGRALWAAERTQEAVDALVRACDLHGSTGDRVREARARNNLGIALLTKGRTHEALEAFSNALEIRRDFDDWYETGRTLRNLALIHHALGNRVTARGHWRQAADAYTRAEAPAEAAEALGHLPKRRLRRAVG